MPTTNFHLDTARFAEGDNYEIEDQSSAWLAARIGSQATRESLTAQQITELPLANTTHANEYSATFDQYGNRLDRPYDTI